MHRIPKTFEVGLLLFLLLWWSVSAVFEKTSVGKWVAGYNFELYPMSTFSVYLWPKIRGASVYFLEAIPKEGGKPVELGEFAIFYPVAPPNLDDEIAFKQLDAIEKAYNAHCPSFKSNYHRTCQKHPAESFHLQPDIGAMWLRSFAHGKGLTSIPARVRLGKRYYQFAEDDYQLMSSRKLYLIDFYPAENWRGIRSK